MISYLFAKHLNINIDENTCVTEIEHAPRRYWFTARNNQDGSLDFVKDKDDCQFYLARLVKFPKTLEIIKNYIPDLIIKNSYVTKCLPLYTMVPHIDPGRDTAIIIPLGNNKGNISFYIFNKLIYTYQYKGPTITRVNMNHSAHNPSTTDIRYSITVEVPGSYLTNFIKR